MINHTCEQYVNCENKKITITVMYTFQAIAITKARKKI